MKGRPKEAVGGSRYSKKKKERMKSPRMNFLAKHITDKTSRALERQNISLGPLV